MIDICGVKNFRTVRKRQVFPKLKIFFILRNNHILTRVTAFSQRTSKIKVALNNFPDFADDSSHIIFKLFAWKGGCAIFFNYRCCGLHQPFFKKLLQSTTKESINWKPPTSHKIFIGRWTFWAFSLDCIAIKCNLPYNRHLWSNIFAHIYVCARSLIFKKARFWEIITSFWF